MQVLLRLVRVRRDGVSEEQDSDLHSDQVTIGSAADRDIQLLGAGVAADHAKMARADGGAVIIAHRSVELVVNGAHCHSARLGLNDVVEIGGHRLGLMEAPPGFDLAVRVELSNTAKAADFESAFRTDLAATWLSKRAASWIALLLVAAFGFAIPLASTLIARSSSAPAGSGSLSQPKTATGPVVPIAPGLSDAFWSTGPLTPLHAQATQNQCKACHQDFFVHVQDSACLTCHTSIRDHVDTHHPKIAGLPEKQRCAQCHREHNGEHAGLIVRADRLCVDCHGSENIDFESRLLKRVTRFAAGGHPEFKVTLLSQRRAAGAALQDTKWNSVRLSVQGATQRSNLTFSHAYHLGGAPVLQNLEQRPLKCADCHVLAADGEHFAPVTMGTACSSCHSLTFDERSTARQLPHGNSAAAVAMLEDYYVRKAVDPSRITLQVRRQLPDRTPSEPVCTLMPVQCGLRNASVEIDRLFNGDRGCKECHVVEDSHTSPDTQRFAIAPVRLVEDFFPDVHFNHRAHLVQKKLTGDAACESCHAMRTAKSSTQVLIPALGKCLECHADRVLADHVELRCISCHSYHPATALKKTEEHEEAIQK